MTHGNAPAAVPRSTLVVTVHAGDVVWRAGGAIAPAASRGEKVPPTTMAEAYTRPYPQIAKEPA